MNLHMLIVDFDMLLRTGVALELVTTCQMTHHAFWDLWDLTLTLHHLHEKTDQLNPLYLNVYLKNYSKV